MDIRPTYRSPPMVVMPDPPADPVRRVEGVVEMRGLEPLTPAMRTRCSPS
jgi:hypothetical protein